MTNSAEERRKETNTQVPRVPIHQQGHDDARDVCTTALSTNGNADTHLRVGNGSLEYEDDIKTLMHDDHGARHSPIYYEQVIAFSYIAQRRAQRMQP